MRLRTKVARNFNQTIRVRTVFRAHDQEQIRFGSDLLHRDLTIFCGVADILRGRALDIGELSAEGRDDVFCFVEAERGLGEKSDAIRIGDGQILDLLRRADYLRNQRSLTERSDDFVVIFVAYQYERIAFFGKFYGFDVYLGDQRAGSVDDAQSALDAVLAHLRGNSVSAVDDSLAIRDLFFAVDENGALALQLLHNKAVMDNLFAHVDGRAESFKGDANHVDGANHASAESPGLQ